jgi:Ran GTPase-activating protein (RanGAP) involved in mRNA processing and transport
MGALTKFDISKNKIGVEGGKALAVGLKGNQVIIELNIADTWLGWDADARNDMSGVIALANVIPDLGAMTSLNLARNMLGVEGAETIAEAIKVMKCMGSFECISDRNTAVCWYP